VPPFLDPGWMGAAIRVSLRVAPVFAFAPPFTLLRMPASVRVLLVLALSLGIAGMQPLSPPDTPAFTTALGSDLLTGLGVTLTLQLAFAALAFVGRLIDVQTGHGLAMLIDPSTRAQAPLIGTLFALAAGVAFFDIDGHHAVLRVLAEPTVGLLTDNGVEALLAFLAQIFADAFAAGGAVLVALLVVDLAIAFVSRSLPQMNVLMLGLQLKALLMLVVATAAILSAGLALVTVIRHALALLGG
jgi:flagellar biosynthetic protein FliR